MTDELRAWVLDALRFYRPLGFFTGAVDGYELVDDEPGTGDYELDDDEELDVRDLGDEELADLFARGLEGYQPPFDPSARDADMFLLTFDVERVVTWSDGEWVHGNDEYAEKLERFARASRGTFAPARVRETWDPAPTERGPHRIVIEFSLDGVEHRYEPRVDADWADPGFAAYVARLVSGPYDVCFPAAKDFGDLAFVFLDGDERQLIERERGLRFVPAREP